MLLVLPGLVSANGAADREKALAVIDQAIRAYGGQAALAKAQASARTATGILFITGQEQPFSSERLVQLPQRLRATIDLGSAGPKMQIVIVINDGKGWESTGGAATELSQERLHELQEELYVSWLATLLPLDKDKAFELAVLPETQESSAIGIRVQRKDHQDVSLFFDKKTHLLIRVDHSAREGNRQVEKTSLYSEYKPYDGVLLPSKQVDMVNGQKMIEEDISGYRFLRADDETAFGKP